MIMVPHHPPRLAQLSGVFVVHNSKTGNVPTRTILQGWSSAIGFMDAIKKYVLKV